MFSKIIVNSPWYYFLLSVLISTAISYWLYFKNKKNREAPLIVLRGLFILRFLSLSFICLLLLNIFFRQLQNETQNPVVLLAIDNSSSITAGADSTFIKTEFLKQLESVKKNIGEKFTLKTIFFGSKSTVASTLPDFSEKETDIENLVIDLDNNYSNQNVGALVIVSDGIYNKGTNPVFSAEKLGYPVYTVAMGDTNTVKDVLIQKINHNQVAYSGNNFPVEVIINAKKFIGKEVIVSLLQNGSEKTKQTVKIASDNFLSTCNFTLNAEKAGILKYVANVSVLEGEKNKSNNSQSFVIEVIDNREKILLLADAPHPDIAAFKDAISGTTTYELDYALAADFKKPLQPYSLVILHGFSGVEQQILNQCKTANIPVWVVNPNYADNLPGVKIVGMLNRFNDAEPFLNPSFGLFTVSDDLKKFMKDLPAVKSFFGNYAVSNGANSLINQRIGSVETENPLLLFTDNNGLKGAVFLGDGLWKWKMRDFAEHTNNTLFNELISKSVQYLSVKSDKSFFRVTSPKIINENEAIELGAEVYNKSYELVTEPDVTLTLTNSENKKFNYTFSKTSTAYRLNIGILPAGEYRYEAKVKNNTELFVKQGIIVVKEVMAEKLNTVANHQLLYQLASRTGGKLFYLNQLEQLQTEILKSERIKPITYSQNTTSLLIDLKWLFFVLLALFSVEWFFRKRYLSI